MYMRCLFVDIYSYEREYGYKVYQTVKRKNIMQTCYPRIFILCILHGSCGNPKAVLDGKNERSQIIEQVQSVAVWGGFFERTAYN